VLEINGAIRQTRALILEQIDSSIPWPLLTVPTFGCRYCSGELAYARADATAIVALLIGAISVSTAISLIVEFNHPFLGLMRFSGAPLHNALAQIGQ
jgi:hypothetical protein